MLSECFISTLKSTNQSDLVDLLTGEKVNNSVLNTVNGGAATSNLAANLSQDDNSALQKLRALGENQFLDVLQKNCDFICEKLILLEVLPKFRAYGMRDPIIEEIQSHATNYRRNQAMYNYLRTRDKADLIYFVEVLLATDQKQIVRKLVEEL
uniref:Uncharacterized protein n=1 Tax=Plectus sambesii TaxID=2011161 RepID=A0A914VHE8_9BILA